MSTQNHSSQNHSSQNNRLLNNRQKTEQILRDAQLQFEQHAVKNPCAKKKPGEFSGLQFATALSEQIAEQTDLLIQSIINDAIAKAVGDGVIDDVDEESLKQEIAILAVGGYGQGLLCPYSDIDLLVLTEANSSGTRSDKGDAQSVISSVIEETVRQIWDAGWKLGHAVRSVSETIHFAKTEPHVATSLIETRLLWGSSTLTQTLKDKFQEQVITGRQRVFINDCIEARKKEQEEFGSVVYSLEPNVKRCLGGLRDLQLIRWIGFVQYGVCDPTALAKKGGISTQDAKWLEAAHNCLLAIRFNLHFQAGRSQDVLNRGEQLRITSPSENEKQNNVPDETMQNQRPVEVFMQSYFLHTAFVADLAERLIEHAQNQHRRWTSKANSFLWRRKIEKRFQLESPYIDALPTQRPMVASDLAGTMRLFELAAQYDVKPTAKFAEAVREYLPTPKPNSSDKPLPAIVISRFFSILKRTGSIGKTLRAMHRCGALNRIVPEMEHARGLLQFNQYHQYTVDEHTFRVIEAAEAMETEPHYETLFSKFKQKEIFYLALLIHDLGKGFSRDHSEVGAEIAERVAVRLKLSTDQKDLLVFLVREHLLMSSLAFSRDISDPSIYLNFSQTVGGVSPLRKLYLLTCADIRGVSSTAWTDWKGELLKSLFQIAHSVLNGTHSLGKSHSNNSEQSLLEEQIQKVKQTPFWESASSEEQAELEQCLVGLPTSYLFSNNADVIANDMQILSSLSGSQPSVDGQYDAQTGTVEFRIVLQEPSNNRILHRIVGILTAKRYAVLSAEIHTSSTGILINRFRVSDPSLTEEGIVDQIAKTAALLETKILHPLSVEKLFSSSRRYQAGSHSDPISKLPIRVVIDNESSENNTILDVFAHDRPGLLYIITSALHEKGVSIAMAKIAAHLDQTMDVFYVTDLQGQKIVDAERLRDLQSSLLRRIQEFERHSHKLFS